MSRYLGTIIGLLVLLVVVSMTAPKPRSSADYDQSVCAGPPLRTIEERNDAMETGYSINARYGCIDKSSFEAINAQQAAWEKQRQQKLSEEREALAQTGATSFVQARHGFQTQVALRDPQPLALPEPPIHWFVRSDYQNAEHYRLAGFMSPDPNDGKRHPAIIWLTGGDTNSLSDFWSAGPDNNDQSARAFREAGIIMVFPTLRGGNGQDNPKQAFFGEVDDVLAVAKQLQQIRYVDPAQIYLGGHSTGGTLALLTAEVPTPFRAVFAFGPVSRIDRYPESLMPVDWASLDPLEAKLRSPIEWLAGIAQPTYLIEGVDGQGNASELDSLCAASRNRQVHCLRVRGADHFSVLRPATKAIAERIVAAAGGDLSLQASDIVP